MSARKGDWRDVFAAHLLAVDARKLLLGFITVLITFVLIALMGAFYGKLMHYGPLACLGDFETGNNVLFWLMSGKGMLAVCQALPLFNPFASGLAHFAMSILFYLVLMWVWGYYGGAISRLTALQYARDEIPTLHEATAFAQRKRRAYYFAALTPLFGVMLFSLCNAFIGLIGSIPYVGPWLMAVALPFCSVPITVVTVFVGTLGVLSFGLMMPAISISGKDAFEGWSSAYSYVLWGFNRWVCYSLLALVIGAVTTLVAWALGELFIYAMVQAVDAGLLGGHLVHYGIIPRGPGESIWHWFWHMGPYVGPLAAGGSSFQLVGISLASSIAASIALFVRILVFAYGVSYFFSANTVICFLLRKHVDRIETSEVYEEEAEESPGAGEARPEEAPKPAGPEAEKKEEPKPGQ